MNQDLINKCRELELKEYKQVDIAKKLGVSQATVNKALNKIYNSREFKLGAETAVTFLQEWERTEEFWRMNIKELDLLIDQTIKLEIDNNDPKQAVVFLSRINTIAKLREYQSKDRERIFFLAQQGKIKMAIKHLKDSAIKNESIATKEEKKLF